MARRRTWLIPLVTVALAAGGAGCTDVSRSGSDAPGVSLPAPAAPGQAPVRKAIAGSSSKDIAATLRANGVDDPERWADVVISHQPYPAGDPGLSKLRTVLTDERADPATVDRVVALLTP